MTSSALFLKELDNAISANRMLDHPFYQTWSMGQLTREALREYANQYSHFVNSFPTFLSATHANTPHLAVRQVLLENLIEEERGEGNHPGLWSRFADSLDAKPARSLPFPETVEAIGILKSLTRDSSFVEGVASLYAYESQIPEVSKVKIEGLRKFYGISDSSALSFFTVHKEADVHHSAAERSILEAYALSDDDRRRAVQAASRAARAMLRLLDGVYNRCVSAN